MLQERERRKQHATQKALEAEQLQRAKSIVRRQSMVTMSLPTTATVQAASKHAWVKCGPEHQITRLH